MTGRRVEYPLKRLSNKSEKEAFSESFRIKKARGIVPSPKSSALMTMNEAYLGAFVAFNTLEFCFFFVPQGANYFNSYLLGLTFS